MDRLADSVDLITAEDELRRLVVDIEDLVDWAAAAAPRLLRLPAPLRNEHIVAIGVTALVVSALTVLVSRRNGSR
jgi:hypothetical protein